jgi:hypothetical protein
MLLRVRLRTAAARFADHGWPVTPGSYFNGARMACDRPTCWATSCHPILPDWDRSTDVHIGQWWRERPHSVLLPTGRVFDVIEVPSLLGIKVQDVTAPVARPPAAGCSSCARARRCGPNCTSASTSSTTVMVHGSPHRRPFCRKARCAGSFRRSISIGNCPIQTDCSRPWSLRWYRSTRASSIFRSTLGGARSSHRPPWKLRYARRDSSMVGVGGAPTSTQRKTMLA